MRLNIHRSYPVIADSCLLRNLISLSNFAFISIPSDRAYPFTPEEWANMPVVFGEHELAIGGWQVMRDWSCH